MADPILSAQCPVLLLLLYLREVKLNIDLHCGWLAGWLASSFLFTYHVPPNFATPSADGYFGLSMPNDTPYRQELSLTVVTSSSTARSS